MAPIEKRVRCEVAKADDERRLATVILSTVTKADGTPVRDSQGDVIPIDVFEEAMIESLADGGLGMGEEMHSDFEKADVVQHLTLSKAEWSALGKAMGVDLPPMPEVVLAKLRVHDDGLWAKVKNGTLGEMSFTGDLLEYEERAQ